MAEGLPVWNGETLRSEWSFGLKKTWRQQNIQRVMTFAPWIFSSFIALCPAHVSAPNLHLANEVSCVKCCPLTFSLSFSFFWLGHITSSFLPLAFVFTHEPLQAAVTSSSHFISFISLTLCDGKKNPH